MKALIIYTHRQAQSTLSQVIGAMSLVAKYIDLILIGSDTNDIKGVHEIFHYPDLTHANAQTIANIITKHAKSYQIIATHADTSGKDFLPYYCGMTNLPMLSDITEIIDINHFKRSTYAGAIIEHISHEGEQKVLTIRGIYFEPSVSDLQPKISTLKAEHLSEYPKHIEISQPSDEIDLSTAEIVLSGGRGLGSKEAFTELTKLANQHSAAIGASRAAVDAGYINNAHQVGQTGKIIAPRLYISFGISGAIQHLSGMKDAKTIVAIDQNPDAPIFSVADYGYTGDLFEVIEILKGNNIL